MGTGRRGLLGRQTGYERSATDRALFRAGFGMLVAAKLAEVLTTAVLYAADPSLVEPYTFGSVVVADSGSLVTSLAVGGVVVLNASLAIELCAMVATRRTASPYLPAAIRLFGYGTLAAAYFVAAYATARLLVATVTLADLVGTLP